MRKFTKWSLIVSAGLSLVALPPCSVRADDPAAANAAAADAAKGLAFPAGFEMKTGAPSEGIRDGLAKLTERAVTRDDFNKMLGELSRPDRERAREWKGVDQARLNAQVDRIQQAWKAKYGKDFSPDAKTAFGAPLLIVEGKVTDPSAAVANWPVPAGSNQAQTASGKQPANKEQAKAEKLEKGRNVALVRFPAMGHHPELTVSMIHHLPAFWRIDIPDDRSGEQIFNDLVTHLTMVADHSSEWPDDINAAYRVVGYHVLQAIYGVNSETPAHKG